MQLEGSMIALDKATLQALEDQDLSYQEMIDKLGLRITRNYLAKRFKRYGIHHKTKTERIRNKVLSDKGSVAYLARKYRCGKTTIWEILKENKK
jgi:Mor family transcriptional regulator